MLMAERGRFPVSAIFKFSSAGQKMVEGMIAGHCHVMYSSVSEVTVLCRQRHSSVLV
jgi:hypothetical protein